MGRPSGRREQAGCTVVGLALLAGLFVVYRSSPGVSEGFSQAADSWTAVKEGGQHNVGAQRSRRVVILSSLPRSGSTILSQLVAATRPSVLFFEPLYTGRKVPCIHDGTCVSTFLTQILTCTYQDSLEEWLKDFPLFLSFFHPTVERCFKKPREGSTRCRKALNLRRLCQETNFRIVKVIRARLSWLKTLLSDASLDVRIIHLVRDPRGSCTSIQSQGWNSNPRQRCTDLSQDWKTYEVLRATHPTRIMRVTHEALSLDPITTAQDLNMFIHGTTELRPETKMFLKTHMNSTVYDHSQYGSMETRRDSKVEYQSWRWKISEEQLQKTEQEPECQNVIQKMNHVLFGSVQQVRNASISLWSTLGSTVSASEGGSPHHHRWWTVATPTTGN